MAKTKAAVQSAENRGVKLPKTGSIQHSDAARQTNILLQFFETISLQRVILLLVLACGFAYANSLGGDFVFDDVEQIIENQDIRSWDNLGKAFTTHVWAFREKPESLRVPIPPPYYRPLFTVLFTIEYQLFGLHPQGWHLVSLLLHLLCSIAVYFVLLELSGRKSIALLAALIFAVYSIHVESVSWISGVTDPLFSLFLLAALYCYLRFRSIKRRALLLWSVLWFLFAAFSKETSLCFLPLIFTLEWIAAGSHPKEDTRGKQANLLNHFVERVKRATLVTLPYVAVAAAYLIPRILVLGGVTWYNPAAYHGPLLHTFLTLPWVICTYLFHLIFPVNLTIAYNTSFVTTPASLRFLLPTLILGSLIGMIIVYRKRFSREFWYALALFVVPLLPVLDLRQLSEKYLIFDHYLYLSVAGWAYLLALGIMKLADFEEKRLATTPGRASAIQKAGLASVAAFVMVALLTAATIRENLSWVSPYALWANAARIRPEFWETHYNAGLALLDEAKIDVANAKPKYEGARAALLSAAQVTQVEPSVFSALGQAYDALGETTKAIDSFKRALEIDPQTFEASNNLGAIYFKAGDYDTAARYFRSSLALKPQMVASRFNLALCYEKQEHYPDVVNELNTSLRYAPDDVEALDHLGFAYEKLNKREDAKRTLQRALAISQAKNMTELSERIAGNLKRLEAGK